MSDTRKNAGVWPWIVVVLIGLPVLYVASSGPMRTILMRQPVNPHMPWSFQRHIRSRKMHGWDTIYAPLVWASRESFGEPLLRYWRLFRIPSEGP